QAEDGIRDFHVTGVQTCALPISDRGTSGAAGAAGTAPSTSARAFARSTLSAQRRGDRRGPTDSRLLRDSVGASAGNVSLRRGSEIGRASCRERRWRGGGGARCRK